MVERRVCSFCGAEIEPGTGKMYVKRDGTVLTFDSDKCYKNMIKLGRVPRTTSWTRAAAVQKATLKGAAATAPAPEAAAPAEEAPAEQKAAAPAAKKAKKAKAAEEKKE